MMSSGTHKGKMLTDCKASAYTQHKTATGSSKFQYHCWIIMWIKKTIAKL